MLYFFSSFNTHTMTSGKMVFAHSECMCMCVCLCWKSSQLHAYNFYTHPIPEFAVRTISISHTFFNVSVELWKHKSCEFTVCSPMHLSAIGNTWSWIRYSSIHFPSLSFIHSTLCRFIFYFLFFSYIVLAMDFTLIYALCWTCNGGLEFVPFKYLTHCVFYICCFAFYFLFFVLHSNWDFFFHLF